METMLNANTLLTNHIIMSEVLKMTPNEYQTVLTYLEFKIQLYIDDLGNIYSTKYPTIYGFVCKATYLI